MRDYLIAVVFVLTIAMTIFATDTATFKITTKRSDDRVEVKSEDDKVVFDVRSPYGISNATIERTTEQWPEKVVIQLRLKGLENFKVSNDKFKIEAAISSQTGDVRLWKDGKEDSPLNSKSPYWMELRMMDSQGKATKVIPLNDGYFQMQLPRLYFDGNPRSITLNWIDFYRN